jgi:zinc protease
VNRPSFFIVTCSIVTCLALGLTAVPGARTAPGGRTTGPTGQAPARSGASFRVPVHYAKLPNGLRVVVSEERTSPIVTVEVMYKIGFRIEPKGRTGFAHLFEHMMFQGSRHVAKFEHVAIVNANGGALNGSTRFDYTNYFQVMPSNTLELALWLEADRMRSLDITLENLKNQQAVVSEEVRVNVLNQPHGAFDWLDLPMQANVNWYNAHNFYGDLKDLEAATIEDVRAFFDKYYAPNNAVVVVTGDVDTAEAVKLVEKHFGGIPSRPVPPLPDISEPPQTEETRIVGDESARLYQKLVKETQVATRLYGGFNLLGNNWDFNGPMLYTVRVDYRNGHGADEVLAAVDEVVGRIQQQGITEDELRQAKVAVKSAFFEELEGGIIPGFGRANLLAAFALFDDDPNKINTILGELETVTAADVKAAAQRHLVKTNRTSIDRRPVAPTGGAQ